MSLIITDEILEHFNLSETELKTELAIILFEKDKFTLGQARRFAGINRIEFQKLLAKRKIPVHYDIEDLKQDLITIEILKKK